MFNDEIKCHRNCSAAAPLPVNSIETIARETVLYSFQISPTVFRFRLPSPDFLRAVRRFLVSQGFAFSLCLRIGNHRCGIRAQFFENHISRSTFCPGNGDTPYDENTSIPILRLLGAINICGPPPSRHLGNAIRENVRERCLFPWSTPGLGKKSNAIHTLSR